MNSGTKQPPNRPTIADSVRHACTDEAERATFDRRVVEHGIREMELLATNSNSLPGQMIATPQRGVTQHRAAGGHDQISTSHRDSKNVARGSTLPVICASIHTKASGP